MTPTDELQAALAAFDAAHRAAEQAGYTHWQLEQEYDAIKAAINADVWADKAYSNDTLRKAAALARLNSLDVTDALSRAEQAKRATDANLARAEQVLKTHRALINHYTSELALEAARTNAGCGCPAAGQFYDDPQF